MSRIRGLHHLQLAMPAGREPEAEAFYAGLLGLKVVPKPPELAARGGIWFRLGDRELHLGVEEPFAPARKAHIAFRVDDVQGLARRARAGGFEVVDDDRLEGFDRIYVYDPFGHRLEFLRPMEGSR